MKMRRCVEMNCGLGVDVVRVMVEKFGIGDGDEVFGRIEGGLTVDCLWRIGEWGMDCRLE